MDHAAIRGIFSVHQIGRFRSHIAVEVAYRKMPESNRVIGLDNGRIIPDKCLSIVRFIGGYQETDANEPKTNSSQANQSKKKCSQCGTQIRVS